MAQRIFTRFAVCQPSLQFPNAFFSFPLLAGCWTVWLFEAKYAEPGLFWFFLAFLWPSLRVANPPGIGGRLPEFKPISNANLLECRCAEWKKIGLILILTILLIA